MERDGVGYFAGGELIGDTPLYALAGGLRIGTVIDNYLKTGNLYYPKNSRQSCLKKTMITISDSLPPVEAEASLYTKEEAAAEASRCVRCQCRACGPGIGRDSMKSLNTSASTGAIWENRR